MGLNPSFAVKKNDSRYRGTPLCFQFYKSRSIDDLWNNLKNAPNNAVTMVTLVG